MMKKLVILSMLLLGSIVSTPSQAKSLSQSPIEPYLALEKEIIYHPDQLIADVDKRWEALGYSDTFNGVIKNPNTPSRAETRLQIQALSLDLKKLLSQHPDVQISDEAIEKTWIKDGPISFLSSLYFWLHTPDDPDPALGVDDAWYQVSTHLVAFKRSVSGLFKHKENDDE